MNKLIANFKIDTHLATILGESYRSSEYAIKELVDNAWDADAENVEIIFPKSFTQDPIIVKDDGTGMTEKEVRNEYLFIANSRTSRKGDRTPTKKRRVKGKKGIGKFAGLTVGNVMELVTFARGTKTTVWIDKKELLESKRDIEKVDLPIESEPCDLTLKGTIITIRNLHEKFSFPNPERFSEILVQDYGREDGIKITVDGRQIDAGDIAGNTITQKIDIPGFGSATLKCTITDKPTKNSGVSIRVGGKFIGKPITFGILNNPNIPAKLNKRVYAEIEADGLAPDVSADWGYIFENSIGLQKIQDAVGPIIEGQIQDKYNYEISLQKARNKIKLNSELSKLPEYKRQFAWKKLDSVLSTFYAEEDGKFDSIISVVLDALSKDDYYDVIVSIDEAKDNEVSKFAEALSQFGLAEISFTIQQANNRIRFLDYIDKLISDGSILEKDIHRAIEKSLWIFGDSYSLMSSNETLKKTIESITTTLYKGADPLKRPDLLLSQDFSNDYLLIEFKRPSHTISRDDENQAEKYRDELLNHLGKGIKIEILIIGGKVDERIDSSNLSTNSRLLTFTKIISDARARIQWLLKEFPLDK